MFPRQGSPGAPDWKFHFMFKLDTLSTFRSNGQDFLDDPKQVHGLPLVVEPDPDHC